MRRDEDAAGAEHGVCALADPGSPLGARLATGPELRDAFSEPWRKWEDAVETMRVAQEAEDFQSVGMRLREFLRVDAHDGG